MKYIKCLINICNENYKTTRQNYMACGKHYSALQQKYKTFSKN